MKAVEVFVAFFVAHHVGDYLLQTDWQARTKAGGLGRDPEARRALFSHVTTYTLAFVPVLVWIGVETSLLATVGLAALIFLPHLVVDDGRVVGAYTRRVKGGRGSVEPSVLTSVDQSLHYVALALAALVAAGA